MSIELRSMRYGEIFGGWQIGDLIAEREDGKACVRLLIKTNRDLLEPWTEQCALKVVNIIRAEGRLKELPAWEQGEYVANKEAQCAKARNEVRLMNRLEGDPYIVGYQEWKISDWEEDICFGSDLLIRMQLLETLKDIQRKRQFQELDVFQVGVDICRALICCEQEGVIHRDIKPQNIFRHPSGRGRYMLGDFGISRIVQGAGNVFTKLGTEAYGAPEQFLRGDYDWRVDIYSLGLVLYEISNRNRLPFDESTQVSQYSVIRRLEGKEPLPAPSDASPALSSVILKACANRPEDRFQSAQEFLTALEGAQEGRCIEVPAQVPRAVKPDLYATAPARASLSEKANPKVAVSVIKEMPAVRRKIPVAEKCGEVSKKKRYLGKNQARHLFTDDMLYRMNWDTIRIVIPNGYTVIGTGAFSDILFRAGILCETMRVGSIILPNTLSEIQEGAFSGLKIVDYIDVPDTVYEIGDLPFMGPNAYVRCGSNSCAHKYCRDHGIRNSADSQ